jgi:metal-responsive CopG/Arc/MetJ family transcriptional regulator
MTGRSPTHVTYLRGTLQNVKEQTNVTLSLPESLLRRFRVFAAARNQSMSSLMTLAIRELIDQDAQSKRAKGRFLERIRNAPDRGTKGKIHWTRDELHER